MAENRTFTQFATAGISVRQKSMESRIKRESLS